MRVCQKNGCDVSLEGFHPLAIYCSKAHKQQEANRRARLQNPEKHRARALAHQYSSGRAGPLRPSTPLGKLMRGDLDLTGKPPQTAGNPFIGYLYRGKRAEIKQLHCCDKCNRVFFSDGIQGVRGGKNGHGWTTCPGCRVGNLNNKHRNYLLHRCERCGLIPEHTCQLESDHIIQRSQGGSDRKANRQTLCANCHLLKHHAPDVFLLVPIHKTPGFISTHRLAD